MGTNNEITTEQLEKLCADIEKRTVCNDHTGALKIVCGLLGYEDLHAVLCEIERIHDKLGYLTEEMAMLRTFVGKRMRMNIYSDYSTFVYDKIINAY